ncbi:unnamed protein product [marine sediment metagenome]|uniref:Uncharacterized protein n=1 Tax=marine sediment metagenome TaxID=412755 RepID=X1AP38_9ZZZZ
MTEITQINSTTFETTTGDGDGISDARVVFGGSDAQKFAPNINLGKWDDEYWLNLNLPSIQTTIEIPTFKDGVVDLKIGDLTYRNYHHKTAKGVLEIEIEVAIRIRVAY